MNCLLIYFIDFFICRRSIHQGHKRLSGESQGRQEILMRLAALLSQQFLPIREWRCEGITNTFSALIKDNGRTTV